MNRTLGALLVTLILGFLVGPLAVEAQPLAKMPHVGILVLGSPPHRGVDELRQGLRDLGYVEGQNIAFELRWAEFNSSASLRSQPSWSASRSTSH